MSGAQRFGTSLFEHRAWEPVRMRADHRDAERMPIRSAPTRAAATTNAPSALPDTACANRLERKPVIDTTGANGERARAVILVQFNHDGIFEFDSAGAYRPRRNPVRRGSPLVPCSGYTASGLRPEKANASCPANLSVP